MKYDLICQKSHFWLGLVFWKKLYGHSGSFINKTDIGRTGGGAESSVNLANPVFGEHVRDSWQEPLTSALLCVHCTVQ